jgi:hypothetical protein
MNGKNKDKIKARSALRKMIQTIDRYQTFLPILILVKGMTCFSGEISGERFA